MQTLLLWLFYISSFYAFIPGMISRIFGYRVFRKGTGRNEFALTFDDGPDPRFTPLLLDLLKKYDAKATFFVVGSNAERYPELIRRIHEEGHLIGIHNYVHKTNWLMRPATVRRPSVFLPSARVPRPSALNIDRPIPRLIRICVTPRF